MESLFILAVLASNVVVSEWLVRRTWLRHLGAALLVIILTAVVANVGVIPTFSDEVPLYGFVFEKVAPLSIFWLLLQVNLRDVLRAGKSMIGLFLIGSAGTTVGVLVGMRCVDGAQSIGELHHALGGMFVGTYTGGSVNFNAVALHYGVVDHGVLYAGANAVDSLMTTVWMAVTLMVPRWWKKTANRPAERLAPDLGIEHDTEHVHPSDVALLLALGCFAVWFSEVSAGWIEAWRGWQVPSVLILTSLALLLAQVPVIARIRGTRTLGMFAVLLFLAVIGALCDVQSLADIGPLATTLLIFVAIAVAVHGVIVYGAAALLKLDPDVASVASQANIGGGTSALALARSLGRTDLVLPAILVGALGNALGTFLGFWTARMLG